MQKTIYVHTLQLKYLYVYAVNAQYVQADITFEYKGYASADVGSGFSIS